MASPPYVSLIEESNGGLFLARILQLTFGYCLIKEKICLIYSLKLTSERNGY